MNAQPSLADLCLRRKSILDKHAGTYVQLDIIDAIKLTEAILELERNLTLPEHELTLAQDYTQTTAERQADALDQVAEPRAPYKAKSDDPAR